MDRIGQYILSVVTSAMICGILSGIVPSGKPKEWIRLLSGLIITVTVILPLSRIDSDWEISWPIENTQARKEYTAEGEKIALESMESIITESVHAYILDKANSLGVHIEAEITISGGPIPIPDAISLKGAVSPYTRLQLEEIIQEELGIPKENIQWTDSIYVNPE